MEPAEILRKVEPTSGQARVLAVQQGILGSLLSPGRMARLQEHEAILGPKAYTIAELLLDLRAGIFGELDRWKPSRSIPYRRNLQRAFITTLAARLNPPPAAAAGAAPALANDDSRGAIRAELKAIQSLLAVKAQGAADKATRNHLEDLRDQITVLLDPRGVTR